MGSENVSEERGDSRGALQKDDGAVRIPSHNAYWFQGYRKEVDGTGIADPDVVAQLVERYHVAAWDVLCLQEVQSEEVAARVQHG